MSDLRTALDEKKAEAEQLLEIIEHIKKQDLSITKTAILKSAFILLLYNMIESTTFLVIERIHEKVSSEHYAQLGMHMRKVWVEFFSPTILRIITTSILKKPCEKASHSLS